MIREIFPDEIDEWTRRLNVEWQRGQKKLGNPGPYPIFGGHKYGVGHHVLDDTDETVVMFFSTDGLDGQDVFVPFLLGKGARIDSGELFSWAIKYLLSKGYKKAYYDDIPNTHGEKAKLITKGKREPKEESKGVATVLADGDKIIKVKIVKIVKTVKTVKKKGK